MANNKHKKEKKDILILGDYATDIFLYAEKWREKSLYIREAPRKDYLFDLVHVPGGAGALVAYLRRSNLQVRLPEEEEKAYKKGEDRPLKSFYVLTRTDEEKKPVWRTDKSRGSLPWGDGPEEKESTCLDRSSRSDAGYVIVMDFDGGWRKKQHPDGEMNWKKLVDRIRNTPYLIRSHDPRKKEWEDFRGTVKRPGIWVGVAEDLAEGALRRAGIWEDYVERIVEYLKKDGTLFSTKERPLGWQHFVVIRIDYDGALVLGPGFDKKGELLIFPGDQPGSFLREHPGHVVGGGIAFVASFVEALKHPDYPLLGSKKREGKGDNKWPEVLRSCVKKGLARSRKVMETGYVNPRDPEDPPDWEKIRSGKHPILRSIGPLNHTSVVTCGRLTEDWETALEIVCGKEFEFRKSTLLRIGDLVTADPEFARGLLDLERRLKRHADAGKKVMSFAIFGEPGSGKTFVAESLQKAIDPDGHTFELMSYDVSQFGGKRERLIDTFKAISQTSLKKKTPIVLWDEFDYVLDQQKCGWLQEFLMPMEKAKFNEGKEERELGRCVFVFKGGIHEDEKSFLQWIDHKKTKEEAKLLKAPDFHSRLERVLQIPSLKLSRAGQTSINRPDRARLTRAILIRHFLAEDQYKNIEEIEPKVLAYLLHVTLRYGVRSLKKIIEASALEKTTVFGLLHLPSGDVSKSHVDEAQVNKFLSRLDGASQLSNDALPILWRCYEPKDVDPYTDSP